MDTQIIAKLVNKKEINDKDLKVILYDMCDEVHDSCDSSCIIYQRILTLEQRRTSGGGGGGGSCPYFNKGAKMLAALRLAGELQDLLISRRERRKEGRLLKKIIKKEQPTDEDIERILHDICEAVHSSCDSSCPIYKDVLTDKQRNNHHCSYFKNGKAMLEALKMVYSPERFPIFGSSEEIDVLDRENTGKHLDRRRRRKER